MTSQLNTWATRDLKMFTGADQRENFSRLASIFPVRVVRRSDSPKRIPTGRTVELPATFPLLGQLRSTAKFLSEVDTVGLMVIKQNEIVHEWYENTHQPTLQWPCWSISKSVASCLIGIALAERAIDSLQDPVTRYAPALIGSGYEGVSIEQVLQMCSGVRWNENYADLNSDVRRNARVMAGIGSRNELAIATTQMHRPGTRHQYNSNDTQVLGMVLRGALRTDLTRMLQEKLWVPLGMEDDAFIMVDASGVEWAAGGLQATLRDVAKFGRLYLNQGAVDGMQIVAKEWIAQSTIARADHLRPGPKEISPGCFGYGYQWWLAPENDGAYCAIGVYNQYLYVNPRRAVVIAKMSANRNFACSYDEAGYRDEEHLALFAAIANLI